MNTIFHRSNNLRIWHLLWIGVLLLSLLSITTAQTEEIIQVGEINNNQIINTVYGPENLPIVDYLLKVTSEPRVALQGENVNYTIMVTNEGDEIATGISITEILPAGSRLVSIDTPDTLYGNRCEADTLTCSFSDLNPGSAITVTVVISNMQAEKLENTVTVMSNEYPSDIKKTWTSVIPYLSVDVSSTPNPLEMKITQTVLHYTLKVKLSSEAPTTATGIQLESQLPQGFELKTITSDNANCDISQMPLITCSLIDLNVDSQDNINQATIDIDVVLKDAGLLLWTHEAKVTANEYPEHTDRERTQIFIPEDIQVDIVFVIDVTNSMQGEIDGIIKALKDFMAEIDPSTAPLAALVTFRDEVKINTFSHDMNVLLEAISKLTMSGGGTCAEASAEALNIAIPHTKIGGNILFASDASPYPDADINGLTEMMLSKGIRFNAMITGDCSQKDSRN
jgi:uncharacterized repeat protein (TIGR01451 family)